jgi:hypothetical protein
MSCSREAIMRLRKFAILGLVGLASSGTAHAASTTAHAMIVSGLAHGGSGEFGCATSGPQPLVHNFFNLGAGLPTEGYASCHLSGGIDDTSSAVGPSTAHEDLSNTFSNGLHMQTADATADFSTLKASSNGSYTGNATGGFAYEDGEAAAFSTDTLTPVAGAKFVQMGFTIDGSASVVGNSQVLTELDYQINSAPVIQMFIGDIEAGGTPIVENPTDIGSLGGFTITPTSYSGSGTVFTFLEPITPGASFDLTLGLYAGSFPVPLGGVANDDFSETATLTSIAVYDANMNPLDATLTSASGRIYDATGVHSPAMGVPEAPTWMMLLLSFGILGTALRRKRSAVEWAAAR